MNHKTLLKAAATVERIKVLDAEIISLDKLAMQLADRPNECSVTLKAKDLAPPKQEKQQILDEDGSIIKPNDTPTNLTHGLSMFSYFYGSQPSAQQPKEDQSTTAINFSLADTDMIQIIGFMIKARDTERQQYIQALSDLGVRF